MKLTDKYTLKTIGDVHMIVPANGTAEDFRKMMSLNETGLLLWNSLLCGNTRQGLLAAMTSVYDIDAATAQADIDEFLQMLRQLGALQEDEEE